MSKIKNKCPEEALDIKMILDEKPYNLQTAKKYADEMSQKYQKLYCVVKDNKERRKIYHVIGFNHFRKTLVNYELYHITNYIKIKI